jgi:hypothetical protein
VTSALFRYLSWLSRCADMIRLLKNYAYAVALPPLGIYALNPVATQTFQSYSILSNPSNCQQPTNLQRMAGPLTVFDMTMFVPPFSVQSSGATATQSFSPHASECLGRPMVSRIRNSLPWARRLFTRERFEILLA